MPATPPPVGEFWQVTLFLKNLEGSGCSETYLIPQGKVPDVSALFPDFATARRQILNSSWTLMGARLSDPALFRDIYLPADAGGFGVGLISGTALPYESALLIKIQYADHIVLSRPFHGFTNGDMQEESLFVDAGPTTSAKVNTFIGQLQTMLFLNVANKKPTIRFPTPWTGHEIVNGNIFHFRARDIGRPFGLRRGRSLAT